MSVNRSSELCAGNRTDFGGNDDCEEAAGGSGLYYALFILGMVVAGSGCTPMYALGIPYMDENVKAKASPMYVGIFAGSGIVGKLPWQLRVRLTAVVRNNTSLNGVPHEHILTLSEARWGLLHAVLFKVSC